MTASPDTPQVALVVDDEPIIRMVAVDMLSDHGFLTYEAGDGVEALHVLASHPEILLLVTDINMPGAPDGLGLACEARNRRPQLRIVVTSGRVKPGPDELPIGGRFVPKCRTDLKSETRCKIDPKSENLTLESVTRPEQACGDRIADFDQLHPIKIWPLLC